MERITENIVKKVALRFFRSYYKNRLRDERFPIDAKYDLEAAGGIIADGYYAFTTSKGKRFVATFEATDSANIDEVLFKPQWKLMLWDGLAFSCMLVAAFSFLNYVYQFDQLAPGKIPGRVGLVFLISSLILAGFVAIARQFVRYRYIYAVEQFKKYYADEQWIALAEDAFESTTEPAFKELKRQSIMNGIGLLSVDEQLEAKILITPSRYDLFQGKRKPLSFQSPGTALTTFKEEGWWTALGFRLPARANGKKSIYRYRKSFTTQLAITIAALFLTMIINLQEWKRAPLQTIDKEHYRQDVAKSESNKLAEQPEYLVDTLPGKVIAPKDEWFLPAINNTVAVDQKELAINISNYPCERYNNFSTAQYLIEVSTIQSEKQAKTLAAEYARKGLDVTVLPWACFGTEHGYLIFTGYMYGSTNEARIILNDLRSKHPEVAKKLKVREVAPISS